MARALDATRHDMSLCGMQPVDEGMQVVSTDYCDFTRVATQ